MTETTVASERSADVIVVGAGPAGSATAYHLAKSGLDVLLLEKTAFPREKVCGDGLTPRAVKQRQHRTHLCLKLAATVDGYPGARGRPGRTRGTEAAEEVA